MSSVDKPIMDKAAELFGWAYGLGGFDVAVLEFVTFVRAQSDAQIAELEGALLAEQMQAEDLSHELAAIKAQEPIGWYTEDHLDDKSATTYSWTVAERWVEKGWPVSPLYAAPVSEAKAQGDAWAPSVNDYDHSIHSNPDAREWADFFVATFPGLADKHDLMIGWFANAMMAMHDHLARKAQGVVMPERDSFMAGVKAASDKVKAIVEDYDQRHGSTDPDTGTREYPGNGEEWVCCMLELIEDFTGIVAPSSLAAAPAAPAADAGLVEALKQAFPLFDEDGLNELYHHCEIAVLGDRKRLHKLLATHSDKGVV